MSTFTMAFIPGTRYQFSYKMKTPYFFGKKFDPSGFSRHAPRTLTYLRDECGDRRATGQRVIHHIFQWRGGALECFTDEQAGDYVITKKKERAPRPNGAPLRLNRVNEKIRRLYHGTRGMA